MDTTLPESGAGQQGERRQAQGDQSPTLAELHVPFAKGYTVHSFLGQGSSGNVWKATQEGTLREVALKFLAPWARPGLGGLRFAREAEIGGALQHKNIAHIFDNGAGADGAWLAMELVKGTSVERWSAEQHPGLRDKMEVFRQICEGMVHAHQRGVLHRDLKPGNVLLTEDGIPKIVDFGLACWRESPSLDVTLTQQGEVFGSLAWMPPEQAAGRWQEVDALSDVYALGAILFSLLCGRAPLDRALPIPALLAAAQSADRPLLRAVCREAPKDLAAIADKCLAMEKRFRYQSSAELYEDVTRWLAGDTVRARSEAPLYWMAKKIRRHWAAVAATAAVICGAGGMAWAREEARRNLEYSQRQTFLREAAQTAQTLHEAQDLVSRILVEMPQQSGTSANLEWAAKVGQMLASFPWSLKGGSGSYDSNPFRARAAMSIAEDQMKKQRWTTALPRWQQAILHLKVLVATHPERSVYASDLARARIGEMEALLELGYHGDAVRAAQEALQVPLPPSDLAPDDALLQSLVNATAHLAKSVLAAAGRVETTLEIVRLVSQRIPPDTPTPRPRGLYQGWLAQLACLEVALKTRLQGAAAAASIAETAVARARNYGELSENGELAGIVLVECLAAEANVKRALGDADAATARLLEATSVLARKKSKSERSKVAMAAYKSLANSWVSQAGFHEERGRWEETIVANEHALKCCAVMNRMNPEDTGPLLMSARLYLQNARHWNARAQKSPSIRCATASAGRFKTVLEKRRSDEVELFLDQAEAALLLAELDAPPPQPDQIWAEIARSAMLSPQKKRDLLKPQDAARLQALEQRRHQLPP